MRESSLRGTEGADDCPTVAAKMRSCWLPASAASKALLPDYYTLSIARTHKHHFLFYCLPESVALYNASTRHEASRFPQRPTNATIYNSNNSSLAHLLPSKTCQTILGKMQMISTDQKML